MKQTVFKNTLINSNESRKYLTDNDIESPSIDGMVRLDSRTEISVPKHIKSFDELNQFIEDKRKLLGIK